MEGRQLWTDERVRRLGVALLIALVLACVLKYAGDAERSSALKRGDFPGIISPAVILAEGKAAQLYSINLHHEIQRSMWPTFADEMYISVYPPFFGAMLIPLAWLEPQDARNVWTILSLLCYFAALCILRPISPALREHFLFVSVSLLLFAPVLFGVLGGQNTAFSMLLVAAMVRLLERGGPTSDFLAGVLAGLWLFKPQFGVLAGAWLLLQRKPRALLGFAAVACFYWLLAAHYAGTDWISKWFTATQEFAAINFTINDNQMTSFAGALSSLARQSFLPTKAVLPVSALLSLALLGLVWKGRVRSGWLFAPLLVLISPQTLFYDLSIVLVACLPFVEFKNDRDVAVYLAAGIAAALAFAARSYCFFALPFLLAVAALVFIYGRAAPRRMTGVTSASA